MTDDIESRTARAFIKQSIELLEEQYLSRIEACLDHLSDEQIWWRSNEVSNSIGNLILHLCGNARQWIVAGVGGLTDARNRDSEFAQREVISRAELLRLMRSTIDDVAGVLRNLDVATILDKRVIQGTETDVLSAIFHVTEHFSMHTGQIILLTKQLTARDLHFYDL